MIKKIYIDSDIILDLLQVRHPFHDDAFSLFAQIENGIVKGFVSPLVFSNLFYILRKDGNNKSAVDSLIRLKMLLKIVSIGEKIIELALTSSFNDFEDAIQYFTAIECKADCLITRNKKDYKNADIPVLFPDECLKLITQ
ncbi:MAG: PIN domain-containing protein [Chitinivibrionales bacterium]|nr:PIN domain-containing protein [Chitinivibrionales bacterium]